MIIFAFNLSAFFVCSLFPIQNIHTTKLTNFWICGFPFAKQLYARREWQSHSQS